VPQTPAAIERHTIAVIVDNEPGVLARVIGLFSGRGYNIESLTVAETDAAKHQSRITVVTTGTPMVIEQIKAQLDRLVPVHRVSDLTQEGAHVARELALVKVISKGNERVEALRIADIFRAKAILCQSDGAARPRRGQPHRHRRHCARRSADVNPPPSFIETPVKNTPEERDPCAFTTTATRT
jgi:acetolactate synthase-1/3 small subunit